MEYLILKNNYVVNKIESGTDPTFYESFVKTSDVTSNGYWRGGYYDSSTNTIKPPLQFYINSLQSVYPSGSSYTITFGLDSCNVDNLDISNFEITEADVSNYLVESGSQVTLDISPLHSDVDITLKVNLPDLKLYPEQQILTNLRDIITLRVS